MASYISRTGDFHDPDQMKRSMLALNDQRNLSQFCDVVLRVSSTQIYAHSNVLAAASPYFESFLGIGSDCPRMFSQKHQQIIEIHIDAKDDDNSYGEAVSKVVEFMYTSHITLTPTLVFQVIEIGKIMQMDKLLEFCEIFQNGDDSNYPRDVATCTTGLQEIANLLGSRSRTIKQVTVATETEDTMFKKLESSELTPNMLPPSTDMLQPLSAEHSQSSSSSINNTKEDMPVAENNFKLLELETTCYDADHVSQNHASLLLAISDVRPPVIHSENSGTEAAAAAPEQQLEVNNSNKEPFNILQALSAANASVEKSVEDVDALMHEAAVEPQPMYSVVPMPEEFTPNDSQEKKDFNLNDISDLVKFESLATTLFQISRGRGRGRPRGRCRGRGRGRGRRPGRPRKVKEEPDSDPEFEHFIDQVEKSGSSAIPMESDEGDDNDKMNVDKDANSEENGTESKLCDISGRGVEESGALNWKSRRRRSKPSQLRKDYVMHSLTKRSRKHKSARLEEAKSLDADTKLEDSAVAISNVKLVCPKCDFTTLHFKDYRQHLKIHPETDPRYFVCEKCQFKTTKSREFNSHKHNHMREELICSLCGHQSESGVEFVEHSRKHEGDLPFFCTECESRFKTKNQLIAHRPKHQMEKPFVCAICNSGFKWKHALKNHMITHSATKDHLCDVCGYATAHKSQLKAHKLIHTGHMFKCPVTECHFEATKRQNLKYHMITHTHEKPHQCDVCGQSFSLIKNMRRHMLLHTDTRPFSCKICSFSTTRYDKLKEHNLKMHNIGEPPASKKECNVEKECKVENVRFINSSITYVSPEGITINTEGAITAETLQTIAQLASAQSLGNTGLQGTTINIEQTAEDGTVYPIIATVQSYTDSNGEVQYIAEVPEQTL